MNLQLHETAKLWFSTGYVWNCTTFRSELHVKKPGAHLFASFFLEMPSNISFAPCRPKSLLGQKLQAKPRYFRK